jgi:tetratricopeptide (TPR) repeat protein
MKKVLLTLALAVLGQFAIAQNIEVQNAFNYQKSAQQLIDEADGLKVNKPEKAAKRMADAKMQLGKAKTSIDKASTNDQTMNQAKTWHYYAVIYYKIGAYPEFADLDHDAFEKSLLAFGKIKSIDEEYYKRNNREFQTYAGNIGARYYDLGANSYNESDFEDAYINFKKAYDAAATVGGKDNSALLNAAISAMKIERYNESIEMLQQMLANGVEEPSVYQNLAISYRGAGDNDKMIEIIMVAREKFPDDENIMNEMINSYLTVHREDEIIDQILEMAEKNTDKPVYYFILGTIYGNKESKLYNMDTALGYYDKAIQVDPDYVNAYINAGNVLIDKAQEMYFESESLDPSSYKNMDAYFKASDDIKAEAQKYDARALPYIERTNELMPHEPAVIQVLKGIYVRLNMNDKAAALE